jgi:alkylated DNA repair dioxygenase AlkB
MIKQVFNVNNDIASEFYYIPNFLSKKEQIELLHYLNNMNDFLPCNNFKNNSSRYQKWYQEKMKYFCPKWKKRFQRWKSFKYDDIINNTQKKVQKKIKSLNLGDPEFNSCLINKYLNGSDYIKNHRDSKDSFGEYPVIVGISLGSERKINFNKVIYDKENNRSIKLDQNSNKNFSFSLESGSLFIMSGSSQKYFVHEIPKCDTKDIRYSFTFREFIL